MAKLFKDFVLDLPFKRKLFLLFGFIFIIPWIAFVSQMYTTMRDELIKQAQGSLTATVNQINENVSNVLKKYSDLTFNQYIDKTMGAYLQIQDEKMDNYIDAYYLYFDKVFFQIPLLNQNVIRATVYTKNRYFPSDGTYVIPYEEAPFDEDFIQRVKNAKGKMVVGSISRETDGEAKFICARYLEYQEKTNGLFALEISCQEIYDLIAKELTNKEIYVLTGDNKIVSCRDSSYIGTSIENIVNLNGNTIEGKGFFEMDVEDSKNLLIYDTTDFGWKTIAVISYDVLLQSERSKLISIMFFSIIEVLIIVVCVYLFANIITKRIDILAKYAKQMQKGNFNLNVQDMGRDEIGEFAKTFASMSRKINILINDIYEKEISEKKTELNLLQSQIKPHFMYNAFSSISSLALRSGNKEVYEMVNHLSRFYRVSLNNGKNIITLEEELDLVRNYVAVQQVRFGNIIRMYIDAEPEILKTPILKMIIQPFVENSINHGIYDGDKGIDIYIKAFLEGDRIICKVVDNGIGIPKNKLNSLLNPKAEGKGYGIKNVDNRIKLYYGQEYGVSIASEEGVGTEITIKVNKSV